MVCFTSSQSVISDTFKEMYSCLKNNGDLFFYASNYCLPDESTKNTQSFSYTKKKSDILKLIRLVYNLRKYIIKNKIESIFIFSTLPINSLISFFIPNKVRINYYLHDPIPHSGENKVFKTIKSFDDLVLSRKTKNIFISSEFIKKDFNKTSFKEQKPTILPLPLIDSLVKYKDINEVKNSIIFFGRIEKYKGLEWFFEALLKHGEYIKNKKIPIYIVGKGELPNNFELVLEAGFNIILNNKFVSNEELALLINKSKIAIFPYRDATGTSAIQTAGAMGVWPILSDVGGLKESCIDEFSTVIPPFNQKEFIESLIKVYLSQISQLAISDAYSKKYSIDIFSKKLVEFIV